MVLPVTQLVPPRTPSLPGARGPLSAALLGVLGGAVPAGQLPSSARDADPYGEDLQLALHLAYELHYRSTAGVDAGWEWDPDVLRFRRELERAFLAALRQDVDPDDDVRAALEPLLVEPVNGHGTSWHLAERGELWQLREYLAHRSVYHLKEADPQAWVVPRLEGAMKAAFVSVQHDEYGGGRAERMHAVLFARAMREAGLDDSYGSYVDRVPATTLAPVNLMSLTGLHRSLVGAAVGLFVVLEVTSPPGSRRVSSAFARLDAGAAGRAFYDEHVEADAVHEQLLRTGLDDLLERSPELAGDVVFGLRSSLLLEERFGARLLSCWEHGRSSLLRPLD